MKNSSAWTLTLDDRGRLLLPAGLAGQYGLVPGTKLVAEAEADGLRIRRSAASLAKVYVEPTNACNLDCRTCMRNVWDEPSGWMSADTFDRVLEGIREISPLPLAFFGGFGEPLAHPRIVEMVRAVKRAGAEVELITNAILLTEKTARELVEIGLDRLWVSIDGATPASYSDVRLGAELPSVIANLEHLQKLRLLSHAAGPRLGIAFVAMKRNIADLPEVIRLGACLGADRFSVSNVLPHTLEMKEQILFRRALDNLPPAPAQLASVVSLPAMDVDEATLAALARALRGGPQVSLAAEPATRRCACPFIDKGSTSIRWDGAVSPCLPLLHSHSSYLDDRERRSVAFSVGNIRDRSLAAIWSDPTYLTLRERLRAFDFSPCVLCNSCEMAGDNLEDCFGSIHPACGGCLWAQGLIQCP